MNKPELLKDAVNDLESIAALVQYQTSDRDLALAILDCADQLTKLIKMEKPKPYESEYLKNVKLAAAAGEEG